MSLANTISYVYLDVRPSLKVCSRQFGQLEALDTVISNCVVASISLCACTDMWDGLLQWRPSILITLTHCFAHIDFLKLDCNRAYQGLDPS